MPWLEVFTYPREPRDAFLETGIQPPPSEGDERGSWRFVLPHGVAIVFYLVVLEPLLLLSHYGVAFATGLLEIYGNLGLLLFVLALALLGRAGRSNGD